MSYSFTFHNAASPQFYSPTLSTARYRYEAARSFDLDDDLEFCPGLLSDEELQYIHSSTSDRSSTSSGSPSSSPLQLQIQPTNSNPLYSSSPASFPGSLLSGNLKQQQQQLQQPSLSRARNAIPIVNPHTGMRVSSPPLSTNTGRSSTQSTPISRRLW